MIDERSKRKANLDERNAAPVVLADGQNWWIPKPWLEIRPVFRKGRAVDAYPVLTCGPELDALVEAISECDGSIAQVVGVASLAAYLLRWHYDLTDLDLDQLLAYRINDPASLQWLQDIIAIATGRSGPKVFCAGND